MTLEEKVILILGGICGAEEGELEADLELFEAGLLDSFGVIQLIVALEEEFGVSLDMESIPRQRISTPLKIARLVREAQQLS